MHLPTELGHVLKWQVKHERKCGLENAPVEKSKARLEINGSVKGLLYMYNENECSPTWICLVTLTWIILFKNGEIWSTYQVWNLDFFFHFLRFDRGHWGMQNSIIL